MNKLAEKPQKYRILLVDDEEGIRYTLGLLLKKEGYLVDDASGYDAALILLQSVNYDLAFIDIMLAGDNGLDLLRYIKTSSPETQVIVCTGFPQVESAAEAVRLGAFDYITKPIRHETLMLVARHALNIKILNDERDRYRANLDAIFHSVSDSIVMVDLDGKLVQFNATAERICGYSNEMIGNDLLSIDQGCGGVCRKALQEALHLKKPQEVRRFECQTFEGKRRIVSFTATPAVEIDGTVSGAVAVIRDETRVADLEHSLLKRGQFCAIVGASVPMQKLYTLIKALADVPTTVLINGESGTGKELVAAALHESGVRAKGPFIKVNCSALSEHLLESELFGHVRGAFTGAIAEKIGRFQKAHGGTLFLDEIGDVSPAIQMRLLRVLQESEFERVGDSTPIKVDVRIIAATNQNLADKVSQGLFRQDLYYRLNVVRLLLPTLTERMADLELLIEHFITKFNIKLNRAVQGVSDDVLRRFRMHLWPGNVRELEHAIEHACILSQSSIITLHDLPEDLLDSVECIAVPSPADSLLPYPVPGGLSLQEALARSNGNKSQAARLLGISRRTVYRHLEET